MVDTLWKGLADRVAERWANVVVLPAALFWLGSGLVWLQRTGTDPATLPKVAAPYASPWWIAAVLVVALLSGLLARRLAEPVLGLLAGRWHWRLDVLAGPLVSRWSRRVTRREARWQELTGSDRTWRQERELAALDAWLRAMPADPGRCLPTRLGNILAAAERWPADKYGLEAAHCWSRLWLILPEEARKELAAARERLDARITAWIWAVAFVGWTPWAWWAAPVGLAAALLAYSGALTSATALGELQETAFDLHRAALYRQLRWPLPADAASERASGRRLSAYLWRGSDDLTPLAD